jgi:hypothetical protein
MISLFRAQSANDLMKFRQHERQLIIKETVLKWKSDQGRIRESKDILKKRKYGYNISKQCCSIRTLAPFFVWAHRDRPICKYTVLSRNCSIAHTVCHRRTQFHASTIQTLLFFSRKEIVTSNYRNITAFTKNIKRINGRRRKQNRISKLSLKSFLASFNG